jgi:hypothetical protein
MTNTTNNSIENRDESGGILMPSGKNPPCIPPLSKGEGFRRILSLLEKIGIFVGSGY